MTRLSFVLCLFSLGMAPAFGAQAEAPHDSALADFFATPAYAVLYLYRNVAGHARPSSCPMTPSCSTYSLEAFHRHGPFWGYLMTADRLHRCGHDKEIYPTVWTEAGTRLYDPVERRQPRGPGRV